MAKGKEIAWLTCTYHPSLSASRPDGCSSGIWSSEASVLSVV